MSSPAHFQRMYGQDFNPNLYSLIETCADHIHWAGGNWTESRRAKATRNTARPEVVTLTWEP